MPRREMERTLLSCTELEFFNTIQVFKVVTCIIQHFRSKNLKCKFWWYCAGDFILDYKFSDYRRDWNLKLLHTRQLSNPPGHHAYQVMWIYRIRYLMTGVVDVNWNVLTSSQVLNLNVAVLDILLWITNSKDHLRVWTASLLHAWDLTD